jgi:hypothetical protein
MEHNRSGRRYFQAKKRKKHHAGKEDMEFAWCRVSLGDATTQRI